MKNYTLLILCLFLFSFTLLAQRDTVFVDINDSSLVYKNIPTGYTIIDTIENIAHKHGLKTSSVAIQPNHGWDGIIPNLPDTLHNFFVHWSFRNSYGTCAGVAKLRLDRVLIDSIILINDSIPVYYSDTFPSASFDTLQFTVRGTGNDTTEFVLGFYQIRTEIRISRITSIKEFSDSKEIITIFPNPSQTYISLSHFESVHSKSYQFIDMNGKRVSSGILKENKLDVSKLTPGLYLLQIPEKQIVLKFQKQ